MMISNNKQRLALLILTFGPVAPALAADLAEQIAACRALDICAERMACYDAIVADDGDPPGTAAMPRPAPAPAARPVETPSAEELFGKSAEETQRSIAESAGDAALDQLEATITGIQEYGRDRVLVSLDNGQRWRQTAASSLRLDEGDSVVIRGASMGSYKLSKAGGKRTMRVERVD